MAEAAAAPAQGPIPMLLFCPACGTQHVDEGEWATTRAHRSHECQACGHVWRPADVATVGVAELATQGTADGSPAPQGLALAERELRAAGVTHLQLLAAGSVSVRDSLRGGFAKAGTLARAVKKLEAKNG